MDRLDRRAEGHIPACAGAAKAGASPCWRPRVHPCACRGGIEAIPCIKNVEGSSLRVQGRLARPPRCTSKGRFISACAGAARQGPLRAISSEVHPCVCRGGHFPFLPAWPSLGSSLRVQGRLWHAHAAIDRQGFIPACAGAACPERATRRRLRVHPCVCRGGAQSPPCALRLVRFIPACAGAASAAAGGRTRPGVHPCVCRGGMPRM
jgi:hypothetical protein